MTFYNDEEKRKFLQEYNDEERTLRGASPSEVQLYRDLVEEGCEKQWTEAMVAKAFSCYGGDEAYACDWVTSRDLLLKLIEIQGDENPFFYNTLGYIYYYGRCTDGVPDYDTAFKYFSVGAAHGVFESQYKLADMLAKGLGVFKSERAAYNIITGIYDDNFEFFCKHYFAGKFADVAFRMGSLFEYGTGVEQDLETAYYYYLQARYAIHLRTQSHDYFGDKKVQQNIEQAVLRVAQKLPADYFVEEGTYDNPILLSMLMNDAVGLDIVLTREEGGYYLTAKRFAPNEESSDERLVTCAHVGYCMLTDTIKLRLDGIHGVEGRPLNEKAFITQIHLDSNGDEYRWEFYHQNRLELAFCCDAFIFEKNGTIDRF